MSDTSDFPTDLTDQQRHDDEVAAATVADGLAQGDPTPLEVAGFISLRGKVFGAAGQIETVGVETLDTLIAFAEQAERRSKLRNVSGAELDAIRADVDLLKSVRHFRKALKDLGERAAARAKLAGPMSVQR